MSVKVALLCGGIGGAKLALGLDRVLPAGDLGVIVNTGDDFDHMGLRVTPDIDTVLYTLAGLDDRSRGWGRANETWTFMSALGVLGGPTWFQLGDGDLALHIERTRRLAAGDNLTKITGVFAKALGIGSVVAPATDDFLRARLLTDEGELEFQDYFVARQARPAVSKIIFQHAEEAALGYGAGAILNSPTLEAVIVAPSNPYLSIDPILAVPGLRERIVATGVPVIVVSPLVGGQAVKGPTAKIMTELGLPVTTGTISAHYAGLATAIVIDRRDAPFVSPHGLAVHVADTLMTSLEDRTQLASDILDIVRNGTMGLQ